MNEQATPGPGSVEVLRAWIVEEALHCSLDAGAFADAATWGEVLADVARHVAEALQEQQGTAPGQVLEQIRVAFEAALRAPVEGAGPEVTT